MENIHACTTEMAHEFIFENASSSNEITVFICRRSLKFYFDVNHDTKFFYVILFVVTGTKNYLKNNQVILSTIVALSYWISLF